MDSWQLGAEVGTHRPSEISKAGLASSGYLSSLMDLAMRLVRERLADLPESRGEWDVIRALLTQMVTGPEGSGARALLVAHGVACVHRPSERDRFWFTIPGCSKPVHVVARPKNAPPPSGPVVVQGEFALTGLTAAATGAGLKLFLFCEKDRSGGLGLKSATLALVENAQARWIADGVHIVDEVLVFESAVAGTIPTESGLTEEDETVFRSAMTRRDQLVEDVELEPYDVDDEGDDTTRETGSEFGV